MFYPKPARTGFSTDADALHVFLQLWMSDFVCLTASRIPVGSLPLLFRSLKMIYFYQKLLLVERVPYWRCLTGPFLRAQCCRVLTASVINSTVAWVWGLLNLTPSAARAVWLVSPIFMALWRAVKMSSMFYLSLMFKTYTTEVALNSELLCALQCPSLITERSRSLLSFPLL